MLSRKIAVLCVLTWSANPTGTGLTEEKQMSQPQAQVLIDECLTRLARWSEFAEKYWQPAEPAGTGYFGTGYNTWGVQTNQKYAAAMSTLAVHPRAAQVVAPDVRARAAERGLAALRYSLASHKTGSAHCADGSQWGRTWISALGIERWAHALELLGEKLPAADRATYARLLAAEADFQLSDNVYGDPWGHSGHNKPESNIWNGAILWRAALANPTHPDVERWREKAHRFLLNGISVAADAADPRLISGRPLGEWHVGANYFPHYSLDHHAYLNVGYMVICVSNIAMLHYSLLREGQTPPESLYHHVADLWANLRRLVCADGRLARIGGDTRTRYTYCQDYLIPALIFAADYLGDDYAAAALPGAIRLLGVDQDASTGGAFLSARLSRLEAESAYYYTRLEGDKAAVLAMAADWLSWRPQALRPAGGKFGPVEGDWAEPEQGAVVRRDPHRLASFCWRPAAGAAMGLCLPPDRGDLAEWECNLTSRPIFQGKSEKQRIKEFHQVESFPGGFLTWGELKEGADLKLDEGWSTPEAARHQLLAAALPDGHTMVVMEFGRMNQLCAYLKECCGLTLEVPNDLWNGRQRRYVTAAGDLSLAQHCGEATGRELNSPWFCVDDRLAGVGLYGAQTWTLRQTGAPRGKPEGSILTDTLCWGWRGPFRAAAGEVLFDSAGAFVSGLPAARIRTWAESRPGRRLDDGQAALRALQVTGLDGKEYVLLWNFGPAEVECRFDLPGRWRLLSSQGTAAAGAAPTRLAGRQAVLLARAE